MNMKSRGNIFIGFYLSLGDLVCAHRALSKFAHENDEYQIYVGVGKSAEGAKDIFLWPSNITFIKFVLPRAGTIAPSIRFVKEFYARKYVRVINSPHAPLRRMSWKIPLFMKLAATLGYAESIEGAAQDPISYLYHKRWPISRELPLAVRDQIFFDLISSAEENMAGQDTHQVGCPFTVSLPPRNAIGIHVGGSLPNKRWPPQHVARLSWLVRKHFPDTEIDILGLPHELSDITSKKLPQNTNVVAEGFAEAVARVTSLRAIVVMDSGFMHVAAAAKIPLVAIFGPSSIKPHFPDSPLAILAHRKILSCQPCDLLKCRFEQNYCMHLVTPDQVMADLKQLLSLK
jgi:ADP-heptose:LPS heptosyltransferase